MVKVYGHIKCAGFAIGENEKKILICTDSSFAAAAVSNCSDIISRWNAFHVEEIYKITIELEP